MMVTHVLLPWVQEEVPTKEDEAVKTITMQVIKSEQDDEDEISKFLAAEKGDLFMCIHKITFHYSLVISTKQELDKLAISLSRTLLSHNYSAFLK